MANKNHWEVHAETFIKEMDKAIAAADPEFSKKLVEATANKWKSQKYKDFWDHLSEPNKVWKPAKIEQEEEQEKIKNDMWEQFKRMEKEWIWEHKHPHKDPVDKLREEFRKEIAEIKDAIRKIGILLDSDAPSEETLRKHKALREAYLKYKMLEKLILGGDGKGNEGSDGG